MTSFPDISSRDIGQTGHPDCLAQNLKFVGQFVIVFTIPEAGRERKTAVLRFLLPWFI